MVFPSSPFALVAVDGWLLRWSRPVRHASRADRTIDGGLRAGRLRGRFPAAATGASAASLGGAAFGDPRNISRVESRSGSGAPRGNGREAERARVLRDHPDAADPRGLLARSCSHHVAHGSPCSSDDRDRDGLAPRGEFVRPRPVDRAAGTRALHRSSGDRACCMAAEGAVRMYGPDAPCRWPGRCPARRCSRHRGGGRGGYEPNGYVDWLGLRGRAWRIRCPLPRLVRMGPDIRAGAPPRAGRRSHCACRAAGSRSIPTVPHCGSRRERSGVAHACGCAPRRERRCCQMLRDPLCREYLLLHPSRGLHLGMHVHEVHRLEAVHLLHGVLRHVLACVRRELPRLSDQFLRRSVDARPCGEAKRQALGARHVQAHDVLLQV